MRPSPIVRRGIAVLAAALAFSSASSARAEGEDAAPVHSMYDMQLADEGMPDGWKLVKGADGAADENAVKDAVGAVAKDKGLVTEKDAKIHYVARTATTADGKKAVFLLMDLDEKSDAFTVALKEAAGGKGWVYREMACPTRLLVVSAPEDVRAKAVDLQVAYAAKLLAARARSAMENHGDLKRILGFANAALALDPKSANAHLALGLVAVAQFSQSRAQDTEALDAGLKEMRAALSKDATGELSAKDKTTAQGELGGFLLNKGGPSVEARDVLKLAVAGAANIEHDQSMGYLYNLACAHARLKELDDAFKNLTPVLEENSKKAIGGIAGWWHRDPDLDGMKEDPRWAELTKKYPPSSQSTSDG